MGLSSADEKSENALISQGDRVGDFHCRCPSATCKGGFGIKARDDQLEALRLHMRLSDEVQQERDHFTEDADRAEATSLWPVREVPVIKILGILFEVRFCSQQHIERTMDKAKIRMGILVRVSGFERGLRAGVLRMTAGSLVTSLLRYVLGANGPGSHEQALSRIGTNIINVMARRILCVGPSARLPALHGAAGVRTINNLYLQHTADLLDSGLRAADSSIWNRLYHWLRESYPD